MLHLDVKHIWIDSLCIVQDDSVEWRTEAAKIGETYMQSMLTIAATWAQDGDDGCFGNRKTWTRDRYNNETSETQNIEVVPIVLR
jgi:hypothetical protein